MCLIMSFSDYDSDENVSTNRPYVKADSTGHDWDSADFEVLLDEAENEESALPSNFLYDEKLLSKLRNLSTCKDLPSPNEDSADIEETVSFDELRESMTAITDDGGVLKKVLFPGVGAPLPLGSPVAFHYSCYFEGGDEPIDSSLLRKKEQRTVMGGDDILPGLAKAVASMRLKERAQFLVAPEYAYGKLGCPPRIPPQSWLLYFVTLEKVSGEEEEGGSDWDWEKHKDRSFRERHASARAYQNKGNSALQQGSPRKAMKCYMRALLLMEESPLTDESQEPICQALQVKLYANMAKVSIDLNLPEKACIMCRLALQLPFSIPEDIKAKIYFRFGVAKQMLKNFSDARHFFLLVKKIKPDCRSINKQMKKLALEEKKFLAQEQFLCKKMFSSM